MDRCRTRQQDQCQDTEQGCVARRVSQLEVVARLVRSVPERSDPAVPREASQAQRPQPRVRRPATTMRPTSGAHSSGCEIRQALAVPAPDPFAKTVTAPATSDRVTADLTRGKFACCVVGRPWQPLDAR